MRVIKSDSGFLVYQKVFKHLQANQCDVVIWQTDESGKRNISESRLNSYHLETKLLHFKLPLGDELSTELPVFCYSEDGQFIFKSSVSQVSLSVLSLTLPLEIKLLEDPDVTVIKGAIGLDLSPVWRTKRLNFDDEEMLDYSLQKPKRTARDRDFLDQEINSLSLDDEDKMFADKRESPRARPKVDKFVKIMTEVSDEVHFLKLFDLSQGGIGFITMDAHLFPKGKRIKVIGFQDFDLDDPLLGQVMSHRAIDETQIEFKIGCKFDEGQD